MHTRPQDHAFWNPIFVAGFFIIGAGVFWFLTDGLDWTRWLLALTAFDVTLMALASFRLVRLVSYDKIMFFFRTWFLDRVGEEYQKPERGFRRAVAELLECPWCTGIWTSLFVVGLYLWSPAGRFLVLILAVAAVAAFVQQLSSMVGRIGHTPSAGGSGSSNGNANVCQY